jgi:hypothetical protein
MIKKDEVYIGLLTRGYGGILHILLFNVLGLRAGISIEPKQYSLDCTM